MAPEPRLFDQVGQILADPIPAELGDCFCGRHVPVILRRYLNSHARKREIAEARRGNAALGDIYLCPSARSVEGLDS